MFCRLSRAHQNGSQLVHGSRQTGYYTVRYFRSRPGFKRTAKPPVPQPYQDNVSDKRHVKAFQTPEGAWNYYKYRALSDETFAIRLLELEPGTRELRCRLHNTHLTAHDKPYIALSYTWGSQILQKYIWCDGDVFPVTQNLHDALLHLRSSNESVYLWVNAICINQADLEERSREVSLMRQIYIRANQVVAWIGKEEGSMSKAFSLVQKLVAAAPTTDPNMLTHRFWTAKSLQRLELPPFTEDSWAALFAFFSSTYFSRIWVVQELVVSSEAIVQCGNLKIPWAQVEHAAKMILATHFRRAWNDQFGSERRISWHEPVFAKTIANIRTSGELSSGPGVALSLLLWITRRFEATDPRDKILAFLGLANDARPMLPTRSGDHGRFAAYRERHTSGGRLALPKNPYAMSAASLYTYVLGSLLRDAKDLNLLSLVEDISRRSSDMLNLPSWVPDLTTGHGVMTLGFPLHKNQPNACGKFSEPRVRWDQRQPHRIHIMGRKAVQVKEVFVTSIYVSPNLPDIVVELLARCKSLLHFNSITVDMFWQTLCGARLGHLSPAPTLHGANLAAYLQSLADSGYTVPTLELWQPLLKQLPSTTKHVMAATRFMNTVESFASGRRMFLTHRNALGLGPQSMMEDDWIVALDGTKVPMVMRKSVHGWRIVGEAFAWGLMHGEVDGTHEEFEIY